MPDMAGVGCLLHPIPLRCWQLPGPGDSPAKLPQAWPSVQRTADSSDSLAQVCNLQTLDSRREVSSSAGTDGTVLPGQKKLARAGWQRGAETAVSR